MTRRRADGLAALVLAFVPFVALGVAFAPGAVLAPADLLASVPPFAAPGAPPPSNRLLFDAAFIFHPWQLYAGSEIAAGRFPLWNPHAFAGAPLFANPQSALLFPLTALAAVLPGPLALTLSTVLKLSVAGLAAYWCFRTLALAPPAALVGALVYQGSAVLSVWLEWSYANAIAVLPLLFGTVERLRTRDGVRPVAWLALSVALIVVAGYPQLAALGVVIVGLWALARGPGEARWSAYLGRLTLGLGLGAALAAVQVLPFVEYLEESSVLFYRRQWTPIVAPPARAAAALLMPWYYGGPGDVAYWGYSNFNEIAASVGLVPWLFVPVAAILGWRRAGTPFFLALAAFALAAFYRLPLVGDALVRVPPFTWIASQRVLPFLALALSALSAIALDALAGASPRQRRACAAATLVAALVLLACGYAVLADDAAWLARHTLRPPAVLQFMAFVALLVLGAGIVLHMHRPLPASARGIDARALAALVIVQLAATLPVTVVPRAITDAALLYPWTPALRHLASASTGDASRVLLPAMNVGALYGLRDVAGYDGMTPRRLEEVASPAADLGLFGNSALSVTTGPWSPVFDLLAIRRLLLAPGAPPPAPHATLDYDGPDARVYRNERAQARAFFVPAARCVGDADGVRLMHSGTVDFRHEVLLSGCDGATGQRAAPVTAVGEARITIDRPHRVRIDVAAPGDGWLVLSDTWFPGWRATVDGAATRVERANHAFRAVRVAAGTRVVELRYLPASVRVGLVVSILALVGVVVCAASPQRGSPRSVWLAALAVMLVTSAALGSIVVAGREGSRRPPAALPPTPLDVRVTPGPLVEGETARLRIAPRALPAGSAIDVYVARIPGGPPAVTLLAPDGRWSPAPVPVARNLTAASPGIDVGWVEQGPVGWSTFVVVPVHASQPPTRRESWAARPILTIHRVQATPAASDPMRLLLLCAVIAASGAIVVLVVHLRTRRYFVRVD